MNSLEQDQDIVVQIAKNFKEIELCLPRLEKLVKGICRRFKLPKVTVSIAIVGDGEIRKINRRFLNRASVTDCLSFDLSDEDRTSADSADASARSFEVVVNAQKALKEAVRRGHSGEAELALYITHGLLHVLGFDDSTEKLAKKMHQAEDEILQQQGYGFVYDSGGRK